MSKPRRRRAIPLLALLLLVFAIEAVFGQEQLSFSAERTSSVFAEGREQIILTGNAEVRSDEFEISADRIEISGDNQRYVVAAGNVSTYDAENDLFLTSDELFFDREDEFLRARGNAYMEDRTNVVVVKGELIQNWSTIDLTEISVNVRILGEDYTARGQFARYRRDADMLDLSGTPEVFWRGDQYRATRITIDLANDEIDFVGDVQATVRQRRDEEETSASEDAVSPQEAESSEGTDPSEEADDE